MITLTAQRSHGRIRLSIDGVLLKAYPDSNLMWAILQDLMGKSKSKDKRSLARDRPKKTQYMIEVDSWCEDILEHQVKSFKRRGWTDREIKVFIIDSTRESQLRTRRLAEDKQPLNVEETEQESDNQDLLRNMYRFDKKREVAY